MTARPAWETVCAMGHRPQHLTGDERAWVRGKLPRAVEWLRDTHGMATGVSGMALGTDMWWAATLVDGGVDLSAHIPFPQQPDVWRDPADRAEWERLRSLSASERVYGDLAGLDGNVRRWRATKLLHDRNDGMLNIADAVLAVWKALKTDGGTASAVKKARKRGLPVVHRRHLIEKGAFAANLRVYRCRFSPARDPHWHVGHPTGSAQSK